MALERPVDHIKSSIIYGDSYKYPVVAINLSESVEPEM